MNKILLLLSICFSNLFCQIDTTALSFFPLDEGNYWEFASLYIDWPMPTYEYSYSSSEIVGDTIMPNGYKYKVMITKSIPSDGYQDSTFYRVDSTSANVYRYYPFADSENHEFLFDSLKALKGDTSYSRHDLLSIYDTPLTVCLDVYSDTTLGIETEIKFFHDRTFASGQTYKLARNFGLINVSYTEFVHFQTDLVFAKINGLEFGIPLSIESENILPVKFSLGQNYPNPFNSNTTIPIIIPQTGKLRLTVYDILGKKIKVLINGEIEPGLHNIIFDGSSLASGVYFFVMNFEEHFQTKKFVIIK